MMFVCHRRRVICLLALVGIATAAVISAVRPELFAARFAPQEGILPADWTAATITVVYTSGLALPCALLLVAAICWRLDERNARAYSALLICCAVGFYVVLTGVVSDWIIDDAAISFAYARNLVEGYGLVLHPNHAPEEGYSNTSWVLILGVAHWFGAEIPAVAKTLGITMGAAALALTLAVGQRLISAQGQHNAVWLALATVVQAPFVVWTASGLENGLQCLTMVGCVAACAFSRHATAYVAGLLSLLVLTRPEAPLVVAGVALAMWIGQPGRAYSLSERVRAALPVAAVPFVIWIGLNVFRLLYFDELLPNPYYAKAQSANLLRLVNVVGGGWHYVIEWMTATGIYALIPVLAMLPVRRAPLAIRVAIAIVVAQVAFMIFAGGDWMGCFRFMAAVAPLFGLLGWYSLQSQSGLSPGHVLAVTIAVVALMIVANTRTLAIFRARPTTPTAVVAAIGNDFQELARRLGIEDPLLAHHDAGGTSFEAGIDVLDLGGLGCRAIAKHMSDHDFVVQYLFEERRPSFVFGSDQRFAAGRSRFHEDPAFDRQYVRVEFPDHPYMQAPLAHVRRDLVREARGVTLRYGPDDRVKAVIVHLGESREMPPGD